MKEYLCIFTCAENGKNHQLWKRLKPEARRARERKGKLAIEKWAHKHRDKIVHLGSPLSKVTKKVDGQGVFDFSSQMGAFIIVRATSQQEAAEMFLKHPHFAFFPGDGVDILEFIKQ